MPRNDDNVILENKRILFRNFAGKERKYNREGDRNFTVVLNDDEAKDLSARGYNVKILEGREEGEPDIPVLGVSVNFNGARPPRIVMVGRRGNKTTLYEEDVELLDWAEILFCDMILRPYEWEIGGKTGIRPYLQTLYANIEETPLDQKYSNNGHEA